MSYFFEGFELDTARRELRRGDQLVAVEPKVFDVLCLLIEHRDRVVSKDELIETVWLGRFISDSAVSTAIKAVRQAVGDDGRTQSIVRTIHGHGFRFVADLAAPEIAATPVAPRPSKARTNLRRRRRELIGRDAETAQIVRHLAPGRIVSVVGPGGAGKSALALEAAATLQESYTGGVWFCELAPVAEDQVESAVLGAIDASAGAGPVTAATIAERFGETATLLVLDNCEHVVERAARLAEDLIDAAPNLALLTTSREALEVPGEKLINLGGLSFADQNSVAVEMFRQCARQVTDLLDTGSDGETLRRITERLDGLPLAIELAAPRLASSTPAELLTALDDQLSVLATRRRRNNPRHSAMDDAIAWSYDLLDPDEQAALASLSMFSGAFTAQAAKAICDTRETRSILHSLVGQSMVAFRPGTPTSRFRLLEPIRQFAARQLGAEDKAAVLARHAAWFAARVTDLAVQMRGADEIAACEALTAEWSDFGRALAWGRAAGRADIAVAPLAALNIHLLWQLRIEAFGWLEAGVAACEIAAEDKAQVDLVRAIGAWSMGDLDRSEALMEDSIAAGGESIETAYFQFYQGFAREDFDKVYRCGLAAWTRAKASGDIPWQIASTAFHVCGCAMSKGDAPEIPELFADVERLLVRHPWPSGKCCELIGRTVAAFGRSAPRDVETFRIDLEKAADRCHAPWFKVTAAGIEASHTRNAHDAMEQLVMYTRNFKSALNSGDVIQLPTILRAIAICLADLDEFETVAMLSGLVPSVRGLGEKGSLAPGYEGAVERARAQVDPARFDQCVRVGQSWELENAVAALEQVVAH